MKKNLKSAIDRLCEVLDMTEGDQNDLICSLDGQYENLSFEICVVEAAVKRIESQRVIENIPGRRPKSS